MRSRSVEFSLTGATLALTGLLLVTFVAFLGLTLFNTKGEPREAVVAVSMLNQGNWVLPVSFGHDLPYKPPMLAWCIAAIGWLNGGHVTEFIARLPSALAAVAMIVCMFRFYARRQSMAVAMVAALLSATAFELHRAATSCRVDMLLAAFVVMAILSLYRHYEKQLPWWRLPLTAIALMSGGVLTKGPVGMLLPCGAMLALLLLQRRRFWPATAQLTLYGLLALILPAAWYVAAYNAGGETFLNLAMEENFGRFMGKMSYESHEHTFLYNFLTLAWGWAPWTLLAAASLLAWRKFPRNNSRTTRLGQRIARQWQRLRALPAPELLAIAASAVIFIFYCIPKSKRSVYLLPMYPFMAIGIAMAIRWLAANAPRVIRVYGTVMAAIGIVAGVAMTLAMLGLFDAAEGTRPAIYLAQATSLPAISLIATAGITIVLCTSLRSICRGTAATAVQWTVADTMLIYWIFSSSIQPVALNPKSDIDVARH
ncbi:MAG: glycosyltransferase family 39 protein, partial [Muribaculaceae bacterium]|nr:glycosyltransferase family 39 protein [Muribaculaceae bacterium]